MRPVAGSIVPLVKEGYVEEINSLFTAGNFRPNDSGCEVIMTLMVLNWSSFVEFEEIMNMLLHHQSSGLKLMDVKDREAFLSPAVISGDDDKEHRKQLDEWQRVFTQSRFKYAVAQIGPRYRSACQCCPRGCELLPVPQMFKLVRGS